MKTSHIIGIIVIAVAITVIISTAGDASTYVTFNEAKVLAEGGKKSMIHVVGTLKKDTNGTVTGIESSEDRLSFKFAMIDENGVEQEVLHPNPMPSDFLKSEQVVVIGAYHNESFVADKILLKCPSKYQEEQIEI